MKVSKILSNRTASPLLALLVCALWGSLFPMIKVGYSAFEIDTADIPSIILFAGLRFTLSGAVLLAITSIGKRKLYIPHARHLPIILMGALFSIILHYGFTYVALALGEGSKSAIIKQLGFLFLICFAFLFDKNDSFSKKKLLAGFLGFAGIIATAYDGTGITFRIGDLLLLLASLCSAVSTVVSKRATERVSPACYVAYTQLFGGVFLSALGFLLGGRITYLDFSSIIAFVYICSASIGAYVLWTALLKHGSMSMLSIIKFTEPLFAVIFSGMILGEDIFKVSYLAALVLLAASLLISHFPRSKNESKNI